LFAERAMFTLARMPVLIRLQTEILMDDLLNKPETRQTLTNLVGLSESADRISRAAESLSQTAAGLPDKITSERQAIVAALDDQAGKLGTLAAELNRTLASGEKMSTSLNTTLTTFDSLMKRFGVGEESTNAAPADTNSAPFNILDYARTAEQLSGTARELDVLLKDLGSTLDSPGWTARIRDVATVSRQASADARSVLNRAFLLGAGLILLTFACAIVYRRMYPRR
jgi:ABC-type transporter Mla subunit MlaD